MHTRMHTRARTHVPMKLPYCYHFGFGFMIQSSMYLRLVSSSLRSQGWPRTPGLSASISWVLKSYPCTTRPGSHLAHMHLLVQSPNPFCDLCLHHTLTAVISCFHSLKQRENLKAPLRRAWLQTLVALESSTFRSFRLLGWLLKVTLHFQHAFLAYSV